MASQSDRDGHLDAFAGREVVFCHLCQNEWYHDDNGLVCPRCESEVTEIVTRESDPRDLHDIYPGFDRRQLHDHDSDPDEADIEEHVTDAPGFFGRRSIFHGPGGLGQSSRASPDNSDDIIRRFSEMIGDFGGPPMTGRSGSDNPFTGGGARGESGGPQRVSYTAFSGPGFTGGVSSFTITSGGPSRTIRSGGPRLGDQPSASFQSVFGDIFSRVGPPPIGRDDPNNPQPDRPPDINSFLGQLFASVLNPNAVHGDGVYTQEALDRIITNLMEANPQSNAPPPAQPETIEKLTRKKLDEEMLGPELKGECTICIDELNLGDEVVVLPCKHWFHDECVVLWLKEHNTCPICRASIDGGPTNQAGAAQLGSQAQESSSRPGPFSDRSERLRSNLQTRGEARLESIRNMATPYDRRNPSRRSSNSPPSDTVSQPARVRSPSGSRQLANSDQPRDSGGSINPLSWIRDRLSGDRRRS